MTRLIDKKVVLEAVKALPAELDAETVQRCIEVLSNQPTVDAVPVRHGRWLNKRYGVKFDGHSYPFRTIGTCSECHETSCDAGDYCPNCGARMIE